MRRRCQLCDLFGRPIQYVRSNLLFPNLTASLSQIKCSTHAELDRTCVKAIEAAGQYATRTIKTPPWGVGHGEVGAPSSSSDATSRGRWRKRSRWQEQWSRQSTFLPLIMFLLVYYSYPNPTLPSEEFNYVINAVVRILFLCRDQWLRNHVVTEKPVTSLATKART